MITGEWSGVLHPRENNVMSTWEWGFSGGLKDKYIQELRDRDNIKEHLIMAKQGDYDISGFLLL